MNVIGYLVIDHNILSSSLSIDEGNMRAVLSLCPPHDLQRCTLPHEEHVIQLSKEPFSWQKVHINSVFLRLEGLSASAIVVVID